jgi:hypothetical protein
MYCQEVYLADVLEDWGTPQYDWVISSGLLEHFSPGEIRRIMAQSKRVARIGVICAVPNAACTPYMEWRERNLALGTWEYGDEFPKLTMSNYFKDFRDVEETNVDRDSFNSEVGYLLVTKGLL